MLLIPAPIFFFLSNDGRELFPEWGVNLLYVLGCLAWLAALAPLGLRYLTGPVEMLETGPEMARSL